MAVSLLVVGRDGNGKSSTGNSILGEKFFIPTLSYTSTKVDCKKAKSIINGQKVKLMEISGLEYPNIDNSGDIDDNFVKIEEAIKGNQSGFCAIAIVIKYGMRFTRQEQESIMMIKSTFGSAALKNYGVLVMTNGDNFVADMSEEHKTFEDWCKSQTGNFLDLFDECENRCVLFNNRTKDDQILKDQREKLFNMVSSIKSKGDRYTVNEYKKAESCRTKIMVLNTLPRYKVEITDFLMYIGKSLKKLSDNKFSPSSERAILEMLLGNLNKHKQYLQDGDKNTEILNSLFLEISLAEKSVMLKMQIADQYILSLPDNEWEFVNDEISPDKALDYIHGDKEKDVNNEGIWASILSYFNLLGLYQYIFGTTSDSSSNTLPDGVGGNAPPTLSITHSRDEGVGDHAPPTHSIIHSSDEGIGDHAPPTLSITHYSDEGVGDHAPPTLSITHSSGEGVVDHAPQTLSITHSSDEGVGKTHPPY